MKIREITVSAGRTFNHPHEQYANLRSDVTQTATLEEGDDAEACYKQLRAETEHKAELHKRHLLEEIECNREIADLELQLTYESKKTYDHGKTQERIEEIRQQLAALKNRPFLLGAVPGMPQPETKEAAPDEWAG